MTELFSKAIREDLERFLQEDDLSRNMFYTASLPSDQVSCELKIKDDLVLCGIPYFKEVFSLLGAELSEELLTYEGRRCRKADQVVLKFDLPFSVALTGERLALNLLQRSSAIATHTARFVEKAQKYGIKILDTRKTTPGLRSLEKYAVRIGGGFNHRFGQADLWLIKDNHKSFFGGVKAAVHFFKNMQGFYAPILLEVHSERELEEAISLGVSHVMLDNFTPEQIMKAVSLKKGEMTYEVSGGVSLDNIERYLIKGVDAISIGAITYGAPPVDISLKYKKR